MGLQLPSALTGPLGWIGLTWPEGDEEKLFEAGQQWIAFAGQLRGTSQGTDKAAGNVWSQNQGEAVDAFRKWWTASDGPHDRLGDDAVAAETIGAALIVFAGVTLALKIQFLVRLMFLAAAVPTFGASLAEIPPAIARTRGQCEMLTKQVVNQIQSVIKQMLERARGLLKKVEKAAATGALGPGVLPVVEQIKATQGFDAKLADDVKTVNSNFSTATAAYSGNCVHVVQALELRRRGELVKATALPLQDWKRVGRDLEDIEKTWGRPFTPAHDRTALENVFKAAGDGSRGIVFIEWNRLPYNHDRMTHVFNVENVHGQIRFVDGQRGLTDVGGYFAVSHDARYMRTDDLPRPRNVDEFARPSAAMLP